MGFNSVRILLLLFDILHLEMVWPHPSPPSGVSFRRPLLSGILCCWSLFHCNGFQLFGLGQEDRILSFWLGLVYRLSLFQRLSHFSKAFIFGGRSVNYTQRLKVYVIEVQVIVDWFLDTHIDIILRIEHQLKEIPEGKIGLPSATAERSHGSDRR